MSYNNDSITYLNNSLKKVDITFSLSDTIDSRFINSFSLYSVNSNDVLTHLNRIGKVNGLDNIMVVDILFENLKDKYIKHYLRREPCLPSYEGSGLKYVSPSHIGCTDTSPLIRGEWIEIIYNSYKNLLH